MPVIVRTSGSIAADRPAATSRADALGGERRSAGVVGRKGWRWSGPLAVLDDEDDNRGHGRRVPPGLRGDDGAVCGDEEVDVAPVVVVPDPPEPQLIGGTRECHRPEHQHHPEHCEREQPTEHHRAVIRARGATARQGWRHRKPIPPDLPTRAVLPRSPSGTLRRFQAIIVVKA